MGNITARATLQLWGTSLICWFFTTRM